MCGVYSAKRLIHFCVSSCKTVIPNTWRHSLLMFVIMHFWGLAIYHHQQPIKCGVCLNTQNIHGNTRTNIKVHIYLDSDLCRRVIIKSLSWLDNIYDYYNMERGMSHGNALFWLWMDYSSRLSMCDDFCLSNGFTNLLQYEIGFNTLSVKFVWTR